MTSEVLYTAIGIVAVFIAACFSAYYKYLFRVRGDKLRDNSQEESWETRKIWYCAIMIVCIQTVFDLMAVNFLTFTVYAIASTSPTM